MSDVNLGKARTDDEDEDEDELLSLSTSKNLFPTLFTLLNPP